VFALAFSQDAGRGMCIKTSLTAIGQVLVDNLVPASDIATLKSRGYTVICYASAGTYESWRTDAAMFPAGLLAQRMSAWDEKYAALTGTCFAYLPSLAIECEVLPLRFRLASRLLAC
jgi:hypothetical protein